MEDHAHHTLLHPIMTQKGEELLSLFSSPFFSTESMNKISTSAIHVQYIDQKHSHTEVRKSHVENNNICQGYQKSWQLNKTQFSFHYKMNLIKGDKHCESYSSPIVT